MTPTNSLAALHAERYLSLETFRKNGEAVRTPVWFVTAAPDGVMTPLYVYSSATSGKVKRLRRNSTARVAACDIRGKITGLWLPATARIVEGEEATNAMRRLGEKYRPWKQILDFFIRLRPGAARAVIAIEAA